MCLHAARPKLADHLAIVLSNRQLADQLYLMKLRAKELVPEILPGQFVHMAVPTLDASILRRPFSIYDADEEEGTVDILYQIVGEGTKNMSLWQPGYLTNMIGLIGRPWSAPSDCSRALLVGGGVGAAPLYMLCRHLKEKGVKVEVILGASSKDGLVCLERYGDLSPDSISCTTDDGTYGSKGFVTVEIDKAISEAEAFGASFDYAAVCGPEPMMRAASEMLEGACKKVEVSMERRMACGIGACLSCVVDTTEGKRRACVDGPIFDAAEVVWR